MLNIEIPAHGLSLANITADARLVDWREILGDDGEGWAVVLPTPTAGDAQNWGECPDDLLLVEPFQPLTADQRERFEQSEAGYDWKGSFDPMMNIAWPVDLAYGIEPARAADLIAFFAPSCVLIRLEEATRAALYGDGSDVPEYVIALTGGGMDLSDNIAAAYLACGCVPPMAILQGLAGVMSRDDAARIPLKEAFQSAREWCDARAARLVETYAQLAGVVA